MPQAKFPFGKDFQIKILSFMFHDFDFLIFAQELVNPNYFSDKVLAWFFTTMRDYFVDFQMRLDDSILRNEMKKAAAAKRIKSQEIQAYFQTYKQIVQKADGKEYVTKELITFCQHQAIKAAALEVPDLLAKNDFDAVKALWSEAFNVGASSADIGLQFFVSWPERLGTRAVQLEEAIFPTGITALDIILGGGIRTKQLGLWMAPTNRGKCLKIGSKVLKYDGSLINVEDVKTGDLLMGPDSTPRRVLGTTRGVGPLYEIRPKRAESWVCNEDHILTLVATDTDRVVDVPLLQYLKSSKTFKHRHKQFSTGVVFPPLEKELPIDPYFMGIWFGDGRKTAVIKGRKKIPNVSVSKPDVEIKDAVLDIASRYGLSFREDNSKPKCPSYFVTTGEAFPPKGQKGSTPNKFLDLLRETMGTGCTIPREYLVSSVAERREFLAGFLDTGGHLSECKFDIVQKRKDYSEAICFVARSLGLRASLMPKNVPGYGIYWRVTITGDLDQLPLRIKRKKPGARKRKTDVRRTGITVVPVGSGEYAGFELDGDGRFLLGDFTVAHNSVSLVHCGKRAIIMRKKVIHYTLELSAEDVAARYDASFAKIPIRDLLDREADLARTMERLGQRMGNSLIIKEYPTKSASVGTIRSHIQQCMAVGFVPDMIIVDYLDLLRSDFRRKEKREELSDITEALRGLAGEIGVPCWSATQSRRSAISKEMHDEEDVAEDIGKMNISDIVITINQTKEQYGEGIMKLLVAKNRNGPRWESVEIATSIPRMCFFNPPKGEENQTGRNNGSSAKPKSPPPAKAPPAKPQPVPKKTPPMRRPSVA